jgi:hypothetical protein
MKHNDDWSICTIFFLEHFHQKNLFMNSTWFSEQKTIIFPNCINQLFLVIKTKYDLRKVETDCFKITWINSYQDLRYRTSYSCPPNTNVKISTKLSKDPA